MKINESIEQKIKKIKNRFMRFLIEIDEAFLKDKGISTMIHYPIPPHQQQCYKMWNKLSYPITEKIHQEELSIPLNQTLLPEEINYIINSINQFD